MRIFTLIQWLPRMLSALWILLLPQFALAQGIMDVPGCTTGFNTGWVTAACIAKLIGHAIAFLFQFVGALFVINVMIAGYQMALGYINGDKSQGVERLRYSIIGIIVLVCAYLIMDLVLNVILG